jgi:hypothetical protein
LFEKVLRISVSEGGTEATFCFERGNKVTGGRRKLINDELHYFYSSIIIKGHKGNRVSGIRKTGAEMRNIFKILGGITDGDDDL